MAKFDSPVLLAEPVPQTGEWKGSKMWRAWCPFCIAYHYHSPEEGHRSAHCYSAELTPLKAESPLRETGYILKLSDDAKKRIKVLRMEAA